MRVRIGNGFDFHRLEVSTKKMFLGGLELETGYSIIAHSDGDIILHTIVDALLGSVSAGDIGTLFPDSDPQWQDASSLIFLQKALDIIKNKGFVISNIDITIMCEHPKIKPLREIILQNLSLIIGISTEDISLKATTTEKMGFLGRGEGIGCFATVCLLG